MNRKLLFAAVAVAAVVALVVGVKLGQGLISSEESPIPRADDVVRFEDEPSKISIAFPASWTKLPAPEGDPEVALRVARDESTSMLVRSTVVNLGTVVTKAGLPVVRKRLTDPAIAADDRAKLLGPPQTVELGGLPGWRYRYTYSSEADGSGEGGSVETTGAHDHYFMFKRNLMIQIVFQAMPKERLPELTPVFERIAASFEGNADGG